MLNNINYNIFNHALNIEYRINRLEKVIERMTKKNPGLLDQKDVDEITEEVLTEIIKKYPDFGIFKRED